MSFGRCARRSGFARAVVPTTLDRRAARRVRGAKGRALWGCSPRTTTNAARQRGRSGGSRRCSRCATSSSSRTWCRQLFVGRERSIAALDEAMNRGKEIFLSAQRNAKTNEPTPEDIFAIGSVGVIMQLLRLPDGTVKVLVEGKRRAKIRRFLASDAFFLVEFDEIAEVRRRRRRRGRGLDALGAEHVRALRQAQQADPARGPDERAGHRRPGAPRRHHRRQPADLKLADRQALLETEEAEEAPRAPHRADAGRDRDPPGREEDPLPRQEADGEDAEGVLPQRADAGHPEGAGRRRARRVQERDPGGRGAAQDQADEQGGHRQGQEGAEEAQDDAPDERRGDRRAQLHRLDPRAALVRQERGAPRPRRGREDPRRGPLRPARRSRSASSSTWPCRP